MGGSIIGDRGWRGEGVGRGGLDGGGGVELVEGGV